MDNAVKTYIPQLHGVFRFLYGAESQILYDDGTVIASLVTGVAQGCPLAALFFCLGTLDVLKGVRRRHPGVELGFYIGDGYLLG